MTKNKIKVFVKNSCQCALSYIVETEIWTCCKGLLSSHIILLTCSCRDSSLRLTYMLQREPVPDDYDRRDPEHRVIYRFVRNLFSAAQLTAECAIVTLVGYCSLIYLSSIKFSDTSYLFCM